MTRAEARERLLDAAITLGSGRGVGALTVQGIATAAGVSKALVLYHFGDKDALLREVAARLGARDAEVIRAAAAAPDALEAWRTLARDAEGRSARALLAALALEAPLREAMPAIHRAREDAAATLAVAILRGVGLTPRHAAALLGRVVLHQLDGVACAADPTPNTGLDASLDAFALSLLTLGD